MLGEDGPEEDGHADEPQHGQHVGQGEDAVGDGARLRRPRPLSRLPVESLCSCADWPGAWLDTPRVAGMGTPCSAPRWRDLRQRRSVKWRLYGADVLPLWVAEMDVVPAEPVQPRGHRRRCARGDTGYPWDRDYAEAWRRSRTQRWGWDARARRDADRPRRDARRGRGPQAASPAPGDAVVVNSPVYPPFSASCSHLGRRVVEAPLSTTGGSTRRPLRAGLRGGHARRRPRGIPALQPAQPDRGGAHRR